LKLFYVKHPSFKIQNTKNGLKPNIELIEYIEGHSLFDPTNDYILDYINLVLQSSNNCHRREFLKADNSSLEDEDEIQKILNNIEWP
tara:strand:+ start:623 stop:883 length:261 start_codon:yes stop_codon:yes gene_type:complete